MGLPHLARRLLARAPHEAFPQQAISALRLALAAEKVYDSVDALARARQAQLPIFTPRQRHDPA